MNKLGTTLKRPTGGSIKIKTGRDTWVLKRSVLDQHDDSLSRQYISKLTGDN